MIIGLISALSKHLGTAAINDDWEGYVHASDPGVAIESYERRLGRGPTVDELHVFRDIFVSYFETSISE